MKKIFSILLAVIIFITAIIIALAINYPLKYQKSVKTYTEKYQLQQSLVYAIIKCESSFDKNAQSSAGAVGLMQIMPSTADFIAEQLGEEKYSLINVDTNIKFGCFYLNYLLSKFNNEMLAIYAYNAGEGRVLRYLNGEKLPTETIEYYKRVKKAQKIYRFML